MSQAQLQQKQQTPVLSRADTLPLGTDGTPLRKNPKRSFSNALVVDQDGREIIDDNLINGQVHEPTNIGKKWQLVYDKIHFTANNGITGQVYKIGPSESDDMCAQWVKKYGRFYLYVGNYKISMGRGAPESVPSDSYLAKKGVALLDHDNYESLHQLFPILIEERVYLEELLVKRSK